MDDQRTRRWGKIVRPTTAIDDPIQVLRTAIQEVRNAPRNFEPRRRLRAAAAEQGAWDQLAMLLADEARAATGKPAVAIAFYEELADCHENLDQPIETIAAMESIIALDPDTIGHHERLAWLYRRANAWQKAAKAYLRVAELGNDEVSYKALRAAARLYRDHGRAEAAADTYKEIVRRRPHELDAWRALDELYGELQMWTDLALVRAELAGRTENSVDKAALMRAQARALSEAGDPARAAALVAEAATHAPDEMSGLVDYVSVLARNGRGREAADLLVARVAEAVSRGDDGEAIAALRSRLAAILEDACGDRPASARVLAELLRDAPTFAPALERLVWQASHDPDPRVHAVALVKHASAMAVVADRRATLLEAARRFRDAGDHKSCVRAFDMVIELGAEPDVSAEQAAAKSVLAVELAKADATSGDRASAERRLRALLATDRTNLDAAVALAELLVADQRLDDAAEHLRDSLEHAPDDAPSDKVAQLVLRHAQVAAALGDPDEAHQLLHEAHHLARRDLPITLALGESCYARKLWREAAIHLGSLADHPDAPRHALAVAAGLARAAQAEVRGLRPQNAKKHLDAAIRLDPACAPALHALGELALEVGDTSRAADLLEAEAAATTDPDKQLRLWDALGDLARDLLGDPARAERCWRRVIGLPLGIARVPVLDKLLAAQRETRSEHRGETAVALAACCGDETRRLALLAEGAEAHAAAGDLLAAREVAEQLIAAQPHDPRAVDCASAIALALGDLERAKRWLRPALTAWDAPRSQTTPTKALHADLWRRLGDAEHARGNEPAALTAYRRAVPIAPDSPGAIAARRGLVELAGRSGASVATSLAALVEAEHEPADAIAWARGLAARPGGDSVDDARAAYELSRGLGVTLEPDDLAFLAAHPMRAMASDQAYGAPLDDADRRALIDDDADAPLAELLEMLWEVAPQICPSPQSALFEADRSTAKRLAATSDAAAAAIYPQIAKAFGGPPVLLHVGAPTGLAHDPATDVTVMFASPPVVVLAAELAASRARTVADGEGDRDADLRFWLGRAVELTRPRRIFAMQGADAFARQIAVLEAAFGPQRAARVDAGIVREAERLRGALPIALRKRVSDRLAALDGKPLDPAAYVGGCLRAADRAGLLACGRVDRAIALANGAVHLVALASMQRYLAVRKKLRPRR